MLEGGAFRFQDLIIPPCPGVVRIEGFSHKKIPLEFPDGLPNEGNKDMGRKIVSD